MNFWVKYPIQLFHLKNHMFNKSNSSIKTNHWFLLFIFIHITAWTLAPTLVRFNLPMDSIEGATWGHQLEWGYDKNPFLNGWLTALAIFLGGKSGWVVYLFSQLSIALGFLAVWKLGKKMLPPIYALLAVFLLEGIQYYNFHAIDFNDNTLEVGLWALTIWFFYCALTEKNNTLSWLLTGVFSALSLMAKYYSAILFLPMILLLLWDSGARKQLKQYPFYLGCLVFLIIITPHFFWLFQHDLVTLHYALDRVSSPPTWENHVYYPAQFAWQQFEALLPAFILLLISLIGANPFRACFPKRIEKKSSVFENCSTACSVGSKQGNAENQGPQNANLEGFKQTLIVSPSFKISSFDRKFLFLMGMGPFLITIFLSFIMGMKLRAGWGQPLFSLWGIILIYIVKPNITLAKFYRFVGLLFILMLLSIAGYVSALMRAPEPSSANFPGKIIAEQLTKTWEEKFHKPLRYVAGTRWVAGNVGLYSADNPAVYIDWNKLFSPWIDDKKLRKEGALFIWDLSDGKTPNPASIQARFPELSPIEIKHYTWMRNKAMTPVEILIAWLPPSNA
ncbi:MAG: glycosyltransferase family 39 protein [Gammaproteobacteria bacterium]|nr:glycosyltransferase family 39 protein [Gammaproteobacteria bacterium]